MIKCNIIVLPAPCNRISYEVEPLTFEEDSYFTFFNINKGNKSVNSSQMSEAATSYPRYVYVYYSTSDETTYTSNLLIDLPTFISSTGGNLGLFLGFSFMGMLFSLYEWIEQRFLGRNLNRNPERIHLSEPDSAK